jgi:ATP synthase protein I
MAPSNTPPDGGGSGQRPGDLSPEERDAFKKRADALGQRLEDAKSQNTSLPRGTSAGSTGSSDNGPALGKALRVSTELIGGIVVGSGLGWLIDKWAGTFPAFFIVLFLLGSAAGMMNVIRAGAAMKTGPANPKAGPSVRDDDET